MSGMLALVTALLSCLLGYVSAAPTASPESLLTSGYYYVQVYSASECASSDSDVQYVTGYALNTCLPQYNTSGSAIGSFNFTCSTDIGGEVNIMNYTSTNCSGTNVVTHYPIDTCNLTSNTDFTDGISYGLSYSHRCVNQGFASTVSALPISFDAVTTAGYSSSVCSGGAGGIQTFSASAIDLCFSAPSKDFYGEFSCDADVPEVTQYDSSQATCPAGNGNVSTLPVNCASISDVSSYYPAKANWLSPYYKSSCNLKPTMVPTAVPTPYVSSFAPTVPTPAPTFFSEIQGYVYKQYYLDSTCKESKTVHYTGTFSHRLTFCILTILFRLCHWCLFGNLLTRHRCARWFSIVRCMLFSIYYYNCNCVFG